MTLDTSKPATNSLLLSAEARAIATALTRILHGNLALDSIPLIWAAGDAAWPTHYQAFSGSPTPARETTIKQFGMSLKVTAGGAQGVSGQDLIPATVFPNLLRGQDFSLGCFVYATVGAKIRVGINDGIGTSYTIDHVGDSTWRWLTVSRPLDVAATRLRAQFECDASQVGYFSGLTVIYGDVKPEHWIPGACAHGTLYFPLPGNQSTGTNKARFLFARPFLVKDVQLHCVTAPTTQAIIVDVNHWDGSTQQSMFSTRPQIAAAGIAGGAQPDATYRYRCFGAGFGSTPRTDNELTLDVDQVGSGTVGADMSVHVRGLQFTSPLEQIYAYNMA